MIAVAKEDPFQQIYERFVDEAAFLWVFREVALEQPHYYLKEIKELETRIERQLDGIMTSPEDAWLLCETGLELEEPGEVFTAAVTAFRCMDVNRIQKAVNSGLINEETFKALVSALHWLPGRYCHAWIKKFFSSKNFDHKRLAIAACGMRSENPAKYLDKILAREDCLANEKLYAQAIRSIGEFKRQDLAVCLEKALTSESKDVAFWAIWSSILLGKKQAVEKLKPYVLSDGPMQSEAIQLAFRVLPIAAAREWITELANGDGQARNTIKASMILGDPHAIPWIIGQMKNADLARLAGEAFSTVTGIDLVKYQLVNELPDLNEQIADEENDDEFVELNEDENLPFPIMEKVVAVWQKYGQHFTSGQRFFMGKALNREVLSYQLKNGSQRRRHSAAYELALMDIEHPLVNTRAKLIQ